MKQQINEIKRMQVLAGILKENQSDDDSRIYLMDFPDNEESAEKYEKLGFEVLVDDDVNEIYSAEYDLTGKDAVAGLSIMEDCERMGLTPTLWFKGKPYPFEKAIKLFDKMASKDTYTDTGMGTPLR
jgi:hypothetical protein